MELGFKDKLKSFMKKKNFSILELVVSCLFLLATIVYFVLLIFGKSIFGEGNAFYRSFNIFSNAGDINVFVRIISYSFFIFGISFIVRLVLNLCLPLFKKMRGLLTILISVIKYAAVLVWLFFVLSSFGVDTTVNLFKWLNFSALTGFLEFPNQNYINENAWYPRDDEGKKITDIKDSFFFHNLFSMAEFNSTTNAFFIHSGLCAYVSRIGNT